MDYKVTKEPHVGGSRRSLPIRADLKIEPRVAMANKPTVTVDLRIAEADSIEAYETYRKAQNATPTETSQAVQLREQTEALLNHQHQKKVAHYEKHGIMGVTPWIITSLGMAHRTFEDWIRGLTTYTKHAVTSACCKRLVRGRALRLSHKP